MNSILEAWHTAAMTSLGLFWMAFWAFGLGYLISSMIQVFVTRERMRQTMGETGPRSVLLASFFGFISSSCSFAALSTTRALFAKGAGLIPSLAFLLASTNLVIELGIVIAVFLSWQFVVGEYLGGLLLILFTWSIVHVTRPTKMAEKAREHARTQTEDDDQGDVPDWKERIRSRAGWREVADHYVMEWSMVWKDVTIGFTVAGVIAAFVPHGFFGALFVGAGTQDPTALELFLQTLVGPVAAFFTFIGSMGNIPLAAVLFGTGVSFAGIIAFIFSDLVVFPVLRIQARYYGWKFAIYVLTVFLSAIIASALLLHYGFAVFGALPDPSAVQQVTERDMFAVDYTLFLNLAFLGSSAAFIAWTAKARGIVSKPGGSAGEWVLFGLACTALVWVGIGIALV
jgi:hypothetical protein